jgi:hypothetical protein
VLSGTSLATARGRHGYHLLQRPPRDRLAPRAR